MKPRLGRSVLPGNPELNRLQEIAFALPDVSLRVAPGGALCFVVKDTTLCYYHSTYRNGRPSFWCRGLVGVQEQLVNSYPKRFFKPQTSSSGAFGGWLGVFLDGSGVDWTEVAMILRDAYRNVAGHGGSGS